MNGNFKVFTRNIPRGLLALSLLCITACASKPEPKPAPPEHLIKLERRAKPNFPQIIKNVEEHHGPIAANRVRYWATLIQQNKHLADIKKLQKTNNFFNDARFLSDQEVWRQQDYWATPVEFLIQDAGDCEDFSIAKYVTLDLMGVDIKKMRITYVTAESLDKPHMVLAYYTDLTDIPLILDNLIPQILPADQRLDLTPVYSFNATTLWLARSRNEQLEAGDSRQLRPWIELNKKISKEFGFSLN
ncbi:MAG: transglutaminase-like cysteine peptidase [Porticoccaceae bacterium]|nr:transglutaminase-like cysteine peptidase [Porticoccaceae bacterium]